MEKIKLFSEKNVVKMNHLYTSEEFLSKEENCKNFGISKKIVGELFTEMGSETVRCDTSVKITPIFTKPKYIETDNYTFIARHKYTGKEFTDFNNVSGALLRYIKELEPLLNIPSKFMRKHYYEQSGNYWYEQYFDIVKIERINKKKKGFLSDNDIKKIIELYQSGEIPSTHKLAEKFKVGHKKISKILKDNNVTINKRGGLDIYGKNCENVGKMTKSNEAGYIYKAIAKDSGVIFNDFNNVSGALTRYITKNIIGAQIPTLESQKRRYFLAHNKNWFEEYFNIVNFTTDELKLKKCHYCNAEIDCSVSNIKYKKHILNEHKADIRTHIKMYPLDASIFAAELQKINDLENKENWITCKICGKKFKHISPAHLKRSHNMTSTEYKLKYGITMSNNYRNRFSELMTQYNLSGITTKNYSGKELEIKKIIESFGLNVEKNRSVLGGEEIDLFISEQNVGIEYNGNKWHTEFFGRKHKNYHLNKTIKANEKNIKLIHLFEDEFEYKKYIVISKLRHILKLDNDLPRVGARKCLIQKIDTNDAACFLDEFHIQGNSYSSIKLGAYYDNNLIGVMSFKKLDNKGNYDLSRFATDYNYITPGLASKLLAHFIRDYNPSSIISFADRRWTLNAEDNLYTKLGFKLDKVLKPDYKYYNEKIDKYQRFHKFNFRKKFLVKKYGFDLNMTETDMIKKLGYDRIWDCGLFRYKMELKNKTTEI